MFKRISLIAIASIFLIACQPDTQSEAQDVVEEFEEFVTSVENNVENQTVESWEKIETEYMTQKDAVSVTLNEWDAETKNRWDKLEARYNDAKQDFQTSADNVEVKFDAWKTDFNQWVTTVENKVSNQSTESWDEIEQTYNEKKAEVEALGDELSDEARAEWEELKSRYEAAREAWKKENERSS